MRPLHRYRPRLFSPLNWIMDHIGLVVVFIVAVFWSGIFYILLHATGRL